jgi:anti-sigma regulatory factor (Ser/Thr protein kinase)
MFGSANDTRFAHPALFYRSETDYRATIVPFVMNGLDLGQPVAVAVPGPRLRLVRDALGGPARDVTMLDMTYEGRNPGRIIAQVLHRFADRHPDQHVRIVGESVWPGRSRTEYPACVQHEALVNAAFAGRSVTILCLYDATTLDARTLADAHATHPSIWADGGERPSTKYAPEAILDRYNLPLGVPEVDEFVVTTPADVRVARKFAADLGQLYGLTDDRVRDLSLIVTELVTNSIVHTPGPGRLAVWQADGHVVCEVRDRGTLSDPLAGRRPADRWEPGGRGLLLVNDLADLVRVHTGTEGTVIRAFLRV